MIIWCHCHNYFTHVSLWQRNQTCGSTEWFTWIYFSYLQYLLKKNQVGIQRWPYLWQNNLLGMIRKNFKNISIFLKNPLQCTPKMIDQKGYIVCVCTALLSWVCCIGLYFGKLYPLKQWSLNLAPQMFLD